MVYWTSLINPSSGNLSITRIQNNTDDILAGASPTDPNPPLTATFSGTITTVGVLLKNIGVATNTQANIEIFASGIKSGTCIHHSVWSVYKESGDSVITLLNEYKDGDDQGGYIQLELAGGNVNVVGYTDTGTWAVSGIIIIRYEGTIVVS